MVFFPNLILGRSFLLYNAISLRNVQYYKYTYSVFIYIYIVMQYPSPNGALFHCTGSLEQVSKPQPSEMLT